MGSVISLGETYGADDNGLLSLVFLCPSVDIRVVHLALELFLPRNSEDMGHVLCIEGKTKYRLFGLNGLK